MKSLILCCGILIVCFAGIQTKIFVLSKNINNKFHFIHGNCYNDSDYSGVSEFNHVQSAIQTLNKFSNCGESYTDLRDGNIYQTVIMGNQCWFSENLKYLPAVHDDNQFQEHGRNSKPAYGVYGYDGNDVSAAKAHSNYNTYGVLYNWFSAMEACPAGWRLPADDDWKTLEKFLGLTQEQTDIKGRRGSNEGSKLAGKSELWQQGFLKVNPGFGSSGFTAVPGGYRFAGGYFANINSYAYWWSSSDTGKSAWYRHLYSHHASIFRDYFGKAYGLSVRCVKDL